MKTAVVRCLAGVLAAGCAVTPAYAHSGPRGRGRGPALWLGGVGGSAQGNPQGNPQSNPRGSQGYLGVDVKDIAEDRVAVLKVKDARGAEITLVDHDGPAGKAGLREHDVVLQMNGLAVTGEEQLRRMLHDSAPGKTIALTICRDGQMMAITAQMANRDDVEREAWQKHFTVPEPAYEQSPAEDPGPAVSAAPSAPAPRGGNSFMGKMLLISPSHTGATFMKMSPQLANSFGVARGTGLLVWNVEVNSPAAIAGMHAGDVVVRADSRAVASTGDWSKVISAAKGRAVTVVVLRDKKETTLMLTPDAKRHSELVWPFAFYQPGS